MKNPAKGKKVQPKKAQASGFAAKPRRATTEEKKDITQNSKGNKNQLQNEYPGGVDKITNTDDKILNGDEDYELFDPTTLIM